MRHKKDGGTYRHVVLKKYDLSPLVGFPAFAEEMPVLRCSKCGDEMIPGEIIEPLLDVLGVCIASIGRRLTPAWATFLRKRMHLTQADLAQRMGCDRQTVAKWETRGVQISKPYDLVLRLIYLASQAAKQPKFKFQVEERQALATLDTVRANPPRSKPDPVVIAAVNAKLRSVQSRHHG
jgi:transcriptional regulator with XRE-family HTH domain